MPSLMLEIGANIARLQADMAKAQKTIDSFASTAKAAFAAFGVGFSASIAKDFLVDAAKMGAAAKQAEESFNLMAASANENAETLIASMKKASGGVIDESGLMEKAVKGLAAGMSGAELTQVAEAARTTARVLGKDVSETFDRIVDAISTQTPRALKQMTLITSEQMAVFNRAIAAGVDNVSLLPVVLANAAEHQRRLGTVVENESEKIQKLKARWEDFKETIGTTTIGVIMGLVRPIDTVTESIKNQSDAVEESIDDMMRLEAAARRIGVKSTPEKPAEVTAIATPHDPQETTIYKRQILSDAQVWERNTREATLSAEAAKSAVKEHEALIKKIEEESVKAQASLYEVSSAEQKVMDQIARNKEKNQEMNEQHYQAVLADLQKEEDAVLAASQAQMEIQAIQIEGEIEAARKANESLIKLTEYTAEQMQQNFSDFFFNVMQGKFESFGDLAKGTFEMIQQAAANYISQMVTDWLFGTEAMVGGIKQRSGGALEGGWSFLSGLFGGGGSAAAGGAAMSGAEIAAYAAMWHDGGMVGRDYAPMKYVPAATFASAPRLHEGLASDEYPAILQKGEQVIPKDQARDKAANVNILINAVDAASFAQLAARNPQAITGPVMEALQRGGQLRNMIKGVV